MTARVYRVESVPKGYILLQPPFMCMCDLLIGEDTCDRDTVRRAKLDVLYKIYNMCVSPIKSVFQSSVLAYLRVLQEVTSPNFLGFPSCLRCLCIDAAVRVLSSAFRVSGTDICWLRVFCVVIGGGSAPVRLAKSALPLCV